MNNKILVSIIAAVVLAGSGLLYLATPKRTENTLGAPSTIYQRTILPEIDSTYELGSSTKAWLKVTSDEYCIGTSCVASWATGGEPLWNAASTSLDVSNFATDVISQWTNDSGYISSTQVVESDPVWLAASSSYLTIVNAGNTYLTLTESATSSWNTAYTDRLKWDGGATGLNATTGRTSLGLGTMAVEANTGTTTITTLGTIGTGTWNATAISLTSKVSGLLPLANFATGTAGYLLVANGASAPSWAATSAVGIPYTPAITLASTTLYGGATTSTVPLGVAIYAETWNSATCYTDTGTSTLRFGDGTNWTGNITATTTAAGTTLSSNNTFTVNEIRKIQIMTTAGSPNYISCSINASR